MNFHSGENRYLNLSAVLKLLTTQKESKQAKTTYRNPQIATAIRDRLFLTMSTSRLVLTISLFNRSRLGISEMSLTL